MGDDIEIVNVEIIYGGLIQIDFVNNTENKGMHAFCNPADFFRMIGESMQKNYNEDGG